MCSSANASAGDHRIVQEGAVADGDDDRALGQSELDAESITQALSEAARRAEEVERAFPDHVFAHQPRMHDGFVDDKRRLAMRLVAGCATSGTVMVGLGRGLLFGGLQPLPEHVMLPFPAGATGGDRGGIELAVPQCFDQKAERDRRLPSR